MHGVGPKRGKRSSSKTDYFGLRLMVFLHGFSTEMMAELIRDGLVNSPPIQRLACRAGPLEPAPRLPTSPFWRVFLQTGHGHGDRTAWLRRVSNGFAGLAAAGSSLDRQKIAAIRAIVTIDQRSRAAYPHRRSSNANSLRWRVLAKPRRVITAFQIHGSRTDI